MLGTLLDSEDFRVRLLISVLDAVRAKPFTAILILPKAGIINSNNILLLFNAVELLRLRTAVLILTYTSIGNLAFLRHKFLNYFSRREITSFKALSYPLASAWRYAQLGLA